MPGSRGSYAAIGSPCGARSSPRIAGLAATATEMQALSAAAMYSVVATPSALIGAASAAIVTTAGRPSVHWVVRQASRLSDPVVAAARGLVSRS